jgi:O-antigen/teichoic acid export membrane protein
MSSPRVPISKKLFLINSASQILTRLLYATVILWTLAYLVNRVPEDELALLPVMMALITAIPLVQSLLAGGLSRYVTEAYAKDDQQRVTELTSTVMPVLVIAGLLLVSLGAFASWQAEWLLQIDDEQVPDARLMLMLLAVSAAISLPLSPFAVGLIVCQRFVLQNVLQLASTLLRVVLLVVLLVGVGPQVKWVVLAQVVGNLSLVLAKSVVSCRLLPALRYRASHVNWSLAREVYTYNGFSSLIGISLMIRDSSDAFILKWLAGPAAVVAFEWGGMVDRELRRLSSFASEPLQPALTAMHSQDRRDRLASAFLRGGRVGLWAVLAPAILIGVFRQELYQAFLGAKFAVYGECTLVAALLFATYPTFYARWMLHKIGAAQARLGRLAVATLIMNAFNLALTLYLVGVLHWGAVGSAAGTLISTLVFDFLVFWPMSVAMLDLPWRRFFTANVLPGLAPATVMGVFCEILRRWVAPESLASLALCIAAGGVVYVAFLVAFCLLPADRRDLAHLLSKLKLRRRLESA